jgi:hypothetical protein
MSTNHRNLIPCTYIGQKGPCTKMCYRGRCHIHSKKRSLALCTRCGVRGTRSNTGICAHGDCLWASQWRSRKMKAAVDDMDAYVEELIRTFDASKIDGTSTTCPAPTATSAE